MFSLPALRDRLNTPLAPLLITAIIFAAYLGAYIYRHHAGTSYLIRVGSILAHSGPVPGDPYIFPNLPGYDGIFFYRLALDPFTTKQIDKGIHIDAPAYRQQRILYPLLARTVGLGQPRWIVRALPLINYLAVCSLGLLGGIYAREKGQHALWGLTLSLTASALMVTILDTAELLSVVLVVVAVRALERHRFGWGALWCTLAVLTRESTLILPFAALIAAVAPPLLSRLFPRRFSLSKLPLDAQKTLSVWLLLIPFAVYFLWGMYLHQVWGTYPWGFTGKRLGMPFWGLYGVLRHGVAMDLRPFSPVSVFHVEYILAFALLCVLAFRTSPASLTLKIAWLIMAGMAVSYTYPLIYILDMGYFRILTDFFTLGALIMIASPSRLKMGALAANLAVFLSTATDHVFNR